MSAVRSTAQTADQQAKANEKQHCTETVSKRRQDTAIPAARHTHPITYKKRNCGTKGGKGEEREDGKGEKAKEAEWKRSEVKSEDGNGIWGWGEKRGTGQGVKEERKGACRNSVPNFSLIGIRNVSMH